jgi:hypothetical protein
MERMAVQRRTEIPGMTARKRFDRYKDEEKIKRQRADVQQDQLPRQLIKAFWKFVEYDWDTAVADSKRSRSYNVMIEVYRKAVELLKGLEYSPRDVERLSMALPDSIRETKASIGSTRAGFFISALINEGRGKEFFLDMEGFDGPVKDVCYRNKKVVRIRGDVGPSLGHRMLSGSITLEGDTGIGVGYAMEGGMIVINGDAYMVGTKMKGGEIRVCGEIYGIGKIEKGSIYRWGKLIAFDGIEVSDR